MVKYPDPGRGGQPYIFDMMVHISQVVKHFTVIYEQHWHCVSHVKDISQSYSVYNIVCVCHLFTLNLERGHTLYPGCVPNREATTQL